MTPASAQQQRGVRAARPQLGAEEVQQLRWLLGGMLTLVAVSTVLYMGVDALTLMAVVIAATVATLFRPTLPAKLPRLMHTLAFPAIVALFSADLWINGEVLPAMVRLDMLLLLYRNIAYRQPRDDLQIIVLGLFLVVVAGVLTVSLLFAAQLLVYTACALAFLLVITLSETMQSNPATAVAMSTTVGATQVPAWAERVQWRTLLGRLRQAADWRVAALGVVLFAGVVAVSALLFLAIPRFQLENSMFLDRFISKKSRTGFSDTIKFGQVTEIQQDNSLALSVDVSDHRHVPVLPYWRMLVLDDYRDGTFRLSPSARSRGFAQAERTGQRLGGEARRRGEAVHWTFYLESGVSRYLPLLGRFELLQFREAQNFRWSPTLNIVALRNEPVAMTAYRIEGFELGEVMRDRDFAERWRSRGPNMADRILFVSRAVDDNDDAILRRIVHEATGGETLRAAEFAERVGMWLRGRHSYTLSPRIPSGPGDPLVRWTASSEAGHCELFAGAFVLLARTAGFPARVVTGFKGGSWNGYSGNFTIRNSDAHAWTEIFDENASGWLRVDPLEAGAGTQGDQGRGEAAIAQRLDRSWSARIDSLRVFWYRRIVSFDQRSQVETVRAIKEATQNTGKRLREQLAKAAASLRAWLTRPWDLSRILLVAGVSLAGGTFIWLWWQFGRGWWGQLRWRGSERKIDPVRREAGRWLQRIAVREVTDDASVRADLQRLRFGAASSWPNPETVFRRARRASRAGYRDRARKK